MKRDAFYRVFLFGMVFPILFRSALAFGMEPENPSPLLLSEAIQKARKNNPDMAIASAAIARADAAIREAKAGFWPSVGLHLTYEQGDAPSSYLFKTIDQRALPPGVDFNDPGWFENVEAGLNARYRLYNGGQTDLAAAMAETDREGARFRQAAVENRLVAAVITAFFDVRAALDFVGIATESVATVKAQRNIMKIRYDGGGVLKSDLLSLEVRLAEAKEDLVAAENHLRLSKAGLARLLGIWPGQGLTLATSDLILPDLPAKREAAMALARRMRPELAAAGRAGIRAGMDVTRQTRNHFPTVDLSGRYWHSDADAAFALDRQNWVVGVALNWTVFDGFSRDAGVDAAVARKAAADAGKAQLLLTIQMDVETALSGLREAEARFAVAESAVAMADLSLQLVEKQFAGGSVTITRYLQAELDRNRARIRKTAAFHDREKARAALARSVGLLATDGFRMGMAKQKKGGV